MKRNKKLLALTSAFLVVITFTTGCSISEPNPYMSDEEREEYLEETESLHSREIKQRIQDYKDGKITDEYLAKEREKQTMISAAMCSETFGRGFLGITDASMKADEENDTLYMYLEVDETCNKEETAKVVAKGMKDNLFYYGFKDTKVIIEFINE